MSVCVPLSGEPIFAGTNGVVLTKEVTNEQDLFSIVGVDHISLAVPSLKEARRFYEDNFKCSVSKPLSVRDQGVKIAYVDLGNVKLELMEPIGPNSPISEPASRI